MVPVYNIIEGGRIFVGRPENTVSVPVSSDDPEVCGFLHGTEPLKCAISDPRPPGCSEIIITSICGKAPSRTCDT